jgi:hypothetical protein
MNNSLLKSLWYGPSCLIFAPSTRYHKSMSQPIIHRFDTLSSSPGNVWCNLYIKRTFGNMHFFKASTKSLLETCTFLTNKVAFPEFFWVVCLCLAAFHNINLQSATTNLLLVWTYWLIPKSSEREMDEMVSPNGKDATVTFTETNQEIPACGAHSQCALPSFRGTPQNRCFFRSFS